MKDLITQLINGHHETYSPATEDEIQRTEIAIGKSLPDSFKEFLRTFSNGAFLYEIQEVSAVGSGSEQIVAIQDIQGLEIDPADTFAFHEGGHTIGSALIPFGLDHNGNAWCFISDVSASGNEYPVAYLDTSGRKLYGKLSGFREWLSILIAEQDEVIWTLYDQEVLETELGLG